MAAYAGFMTHVTCRLTAKNRDQLRNHKLSNRVWSNFTFFALPTVHTGVREPQFSLCAVNEPSLLLMFAAWRSG